MDFEKIIGWAKLNKINFWKIQDSNGDTLAKFTFDRDEEKTPIVKDISESLTQLKESLEYLPEGSTYVLIGRVKSTDTQELRFPFFVPKKNQVSSVGNPNLELFQSLQTKISEMELNQKFADNLRAKEKEIEDLKRKLTETREPKKDRIDKILDNIPAIAVMLKPDLAKNPAIAAILGIGLPAQENTQAQNPTQENPNQEILESSLVKIQNALGDDFLAIINRLGLLAEQRPEVLQTFAAQIGSLIQV